MGKNRNRFTGITVSEGMSMAKAYHYVPDEMVIRGQLAPKEICQEQMAVFHDASMKAKEQLMALYKALVNEDKDRASIFLAHAQLLEDKEIISEIERVIKEEQLYAEAAIEQVYSVYAGHFAASEDELLAARAVDLTDVKQRLIYSLSGLERVNLSVLSEDVIVIANELLPSTVATMDRTHVKGIIMQSGGYNSHCAIFARSFAIPSIFGVSDALECIPNGMEVMLNATEGYFIVNPQQREKELFSNLQKQYQIRMAETEAYRFKPCVLKDGTQIEIGLNIEGAEFGNEEKLYDFVGLFRTEFLYMNGDKLPDEERQFEVYKEVLHRAGGRKVTLRTLDLGGDKTLPYMILPQKEAATCDERGVRFCFAHEEIFLTQLRAVLRASAFGPLQIMFPMVESMEDISRAKEYVKQAKMQLRERNLPFDEEISIGIMIEVPTIAKLADLVAEQVDFASIGTNDLSQYLGAANRHNMTVEEYYQSNSETMRRLLTFIFESFDKAGKPVSVCGEMAGSPQLAEMLVSLGARRLSMRESSIPEVKKALIKM